MENSPAYKLVSLRKISKFFGKDTVVHALDEVSLDAHEAEFITIVGPSGCGKSTLLRVIAGLETPSNGELYLRGKIATSIPPESRDVEWLPQRIETTFLSHKPLDYNLGIGLRLRGAKKKDITDRIRKVSEVVGISHIVSRLPGEVSGGELQRAAIARAMMRKSEVFLFDEPLSSLDEPTRKTLRTEFQDIHKKIGGVFIYVTHDQKEALCLGNRCIVMNKGKIEQDGPPEDVYFNPKNMFVMNFFSTDGINQTSCDVSLDSDFMIVSSSLGEFKIKVNSLMSKQKVLGMIAIRPEDLRIETRTTNTDTQLSLGKWRIMSRQFQGQYASLVCSNDSNKALNLTVFAVNDPAESVIDLSVSSTRILIFNQSTGERIN